MPRKHPVSEKVHDLHAKALLIQDRRGDRVLFIVADLIGVPRSLAQHVTGQLARKLRLRREDIVLNASHTHCGPALRDSLVNMYPMNPADWDQVNRYTDRLQDQLVELAVRTANHLEPAQLSVGLGTAGFAINRRENKESDVAPGYRPKGPIDHDVPVLKVEGVDGVTRAILFGYACHNTTMNFYQWCGDYAGFAQIQLEKRHPGANALFIQGCGGDQNPLPRRILPLCENYGRQLADAVDAALAGTMTRVEGPLAAFYEEIDLPLANVPDRESLERRAAASQPAERIYARRLLSRIQAGESLESSYRYPIQAIQLGRAVTIVALGGEVVVDYSLRLKKELGPQQTWVFGYCNDVMAYIPSRRVLAEGGYEGATSMYYYGLPGLWSPRIEELIVASAHRAAERVRSATGPAD